LNGVHGEVECPIGPDECSGRSGRVLDAVADLLGSLDVGEPFDDVQGHVEPGRDARGGDDVSVVDLAPPGPDGDARVELVQLIEGR